MVKQKQTKDSDTFVKTTGLITSSVLLYIIIFIILFVKLISSRPTQMPSWFITVFVLNAVAIVISIGLIVVYIKHAIKNPRLDESNRAMWVISFFILAQFAMAAYWYKQVWLPSKLLNSRR